MFYSSVAVGVSGGPDSMALCLLAANWKTNGLNAASRVNNGFVDGLLAVIVDHGLRAESKSEAEMVQNRVLKMGMKNYNHICSQHQTGVLLIAHHADDQFNSIQSLTQFLPKKLNFIFENQWFKMLTNEQIFRQNYLFYGLSRNSGCSWTCRLCEAEKQEWVEDPTNQNTIFARNRIRMSLRDLSSSIFKSELQAVILACRRTRVYVDQICQTLINQAVTVMPQGYAVIDLEILNPSEVLDICLSKFVTLLLQFVSQRQRPVRGNAQKLLLDYFRTFPCKVLLLLQPAATYAQPLVQKAPRLSFVVRVNSASPMKMKSYYVDPFDKQNVNVSTELSQIIENGKSYSNKTVQNISNVHFLNATSSGSILTEAKRVKILSEPTFTSVFQLYKTEFEKFQVKPETLSDVKSKKGMESVRVNELGHGQIGHFMDRFLVSWEFVGGNDGCRCCGSGQDSVMEVRHMVDADWLYLSELTKSTNLENGQLEQAKRSVLLLKSIPVAARRSLPVMVNPEGRVVSIPVMCLC
ncbi:putative tRNA(Ile)-lysidine synthetase [Helianthus annuus]|nr:putative tRNA(Ile)-lysidine synthetase [Helianthus annuus]